ELFRIVGRMARTFMMMLSLRDVGSAVWYVLERVTVRNAHPAGERPGHHERPADDPVFGDRAMHPGVAGVRPVIAHDEQLTFGHLHLELLRRRRVTGIQVRALVDR